TVLASRHREGRPHDRRPHPGLDTGVEPPRAAGAAGVPALQEGQLRRRGKQDHPALIWSVTAQPAGTDALSSLSCGRGGFAIEARRSPCGRSHWTAGCYRLLHAVVQGATALVGTVSVETSADDAAGVRHPLGVSLRPAAGNSPLAPSWTRRRAASAS